MERKCQGVKEYGKKMFSCYGGGNTGLSISAVADAGIQLSENTGNNIELDLVSVEKHHIQKVLQHTNGYKPEAARLLGIGLTTLYRKMETYGL